jgi:hypothetical protein
MSSIRLHNFFGHERGSFLEVLTQKFVSCFDILPTTGPARHNLVDFLNGLLESAFNRTAKPPFDPVLIHIP